MDSVGVDAWGCDYALVGERGDLLENPYHYRDTRTDGVMEAVFERVSAEDIYAVTGIQFLPFNTLYQLYAACRVARRGSSPPRARSGPSPTSLNFWLTGETDRRVHERDDDAVRGRADADPGRPTCCASSSCRRGCCRRSSSPARSLGQHRQRRAAPRSLGTPVVAPACHDTGSAVAAVRADGHRAFLSSGTWSLLGTEVAAPVITPRARELNFTNEGGVSGTTRLLKNIAGLWLLQSCRRDVGATRATRSTTTSC